jgi:beta-lactamase regulating signal transducer with metallopeptidase domain
MIFIVTWLWQGLAIAWITAAAVRTMPRLNAATRHAVWWLALGAVLAIPAAHGLGAFATGGPSDVDAGDAARALVLPAIPDAVVALAVALWAMRAALGVLRIAKDYRALVRVKRTSLPFDRSREARLPLWVAARDSVHRGHRTTVLRTSDGITGACALGLGRPAIFISRSVSDALSDESLDEIVMHEQAHLDRYDDWSQLLLAIVGSIAGLHPAVRFLARRLDVDREAACDDRVVSRTGDTRRYACSLLAVAAASNPEVGEARFVPTATTTPSALRVRVGRLLDPGRDRSARPASATSLLTATALVLAVGVSTQLAPVVIFIETAAVNTPAAAAAAATRATEARRTSEPASRTNVNAAAGAFDPTPLRALARSTRATQSDPLETAVRPFAGTAADAQSTAPDNIAANALAPAVSLPSSQPAAVASAPILTAAPGEPVRTSAASAASDIAGAASEAGARARNAGVSIGRFVTRASKAGASVF